MLIEQRNGLRVMHEGIAPFFFRIFGFYNSAKIEEGYLWAV